MLRRAAHTTKTESACIVDTKQEAARITEFAQSFLSTLFLVLKAGP
jgi:hypothetical protein